MSIIGKAIGSITGSTQAAAGAERAAATQAAASEKGIAEQQRQFDEMVQLMSPFVQAGTGALGAQQELLGLGAPGTQQAAISGIEQSPAFQAMIQQQEDALLQQGSATGGLRGGNIQGALAQFRPQLLQQQIQQQLGNLGGLTNLGQASAAGQAQAGQQSASNIGNLLAQQGQAIAGGQLAAGQQQQNTFGQLVGLGGAVAGFL